MDYSKDKHIAIYIGDDTTDEDAFRALSDRGFGIFVATEPRASEAKYKIKNVDEVQKVLEFFLTTV